MENSDNIVSVQVVLKPAAAAAPAAIMEAFRQAGFAVGTLVANNFSITAPGATFQRYFHVEPETLRSIQSSKNMYARELPLDALLKEIKDNIAHVVFSRPLDFGPGAHF